MTDQDWPNVVRLAGVEVRFGPFEVGRRPAHDLNEEAEATLGALGDGGRSQLLRLVHAVQTGVQADGIRRDHLRAVGAAVGGTEVVEAVAGDEKINDEVARSLSSSGEISVVWWVFIHEESVSRDNVAWAQAVQSLPAHEHEERSDGSSHPAAQAGPGPPERQGRPWP